MNGLRMSLVLLVAGVLVSCGVMGENPKARPNAEEPSPPPTDAGEPPPPTSPRADWSVGSFELVRSLVDEKVAIAAGEITNELHGKEEFVSVEVIDGQKILVRCFGEPTAKMQDVIDRFPQVDITVVQVDCSPGRVREFGIGLFQTDPSVRSVSLTPDGSSVNVMLDESRRETSDVSDLERRYSEAVSCPVRVSFGSITLPSPVHAEPSFNSTPR
jgi:hypothetical protein